MQYLGIETAKPKVAFFDFTCCEGCQLQMANKEETLADFLNLVEIVNFREISSSHRQDYDIAFIEGSASRQDQIDRLEKIRAQASVVVALGTCAVFGGVNKSANLRSVAENNYIVYGNQPKESLPVKAIHEVIPVDLSIPGCPVSKKEVEKIVVHLVTSAEFHFEKYPVCIECKRNMNHCLLDEGKMCFGPVTRAGCDAPCPGGKLPCYGCRGPADETNWPELKNVFYRMGFTDEDIMEKLNLFHSLHSLNATE